MNIGQICSVTFSDAVGAFFIGLVMGAAIFWLILLALSKDGNR